MRKAREFILFVLGQYYKEINRRFRTPFLKVTISKSGFIELIMETGFVSKQPRAIYKNLEGLEEDRLISYQHQCLKFTPKGKKEFDRINKYLEPYVNAVFKIKKDKYKKAGKAGQMIFLRKGQIKIE